jgi:hypothetical protein
LGYSQAKPCTTLTQSRAFEPDLTRTSLYVRGPFIQEDGSIPISCCVATHTIGPGCKKVPDAARPRLRYERCALPPVKKCGGARITHSDDRKILWRCGRLKFLRSSFRRRGARGSKRGASGIFRMFPLAGSRFFLGIQIITYLLTRESSGFRG